MKKSIQTITVALLTLGLLSGCNIGGGDDSSSSASSASGTTAPTTNPSGSTGTSTSSEPVGPTFEETLELLVQKAAEKKGVAHVDGYRDIEYLGSNVAVYTYLDEYASNGSLYYFVNEQGYFCYQYASEVLTLRDFVLDPTVDIYEDVLYTAFDVIDASISSVLTLVEETDEAFVADLTLDDLSKTALVHLIGYNTQYASYVTAAQLSIAKDASQIDFDVTFAGQLNECSLTEFGSHENPDAIAFIEAIPPYEPVAEWPADEIAAAFEAKGATLYEIPPFEGEGFSYVVDTSYSSFVDITVNGADADDLPAYAAILEDAGWTVQQSGTSSYKATKAFTDGIATITFAYSTSFGFYIDPYYALAPLPSYEWPATDLAAAFVTAGETAFDVPALVGEGFTYEFSDSYIASYKVAAIYVGGTVTVETVAAYQAVLEDAGWTVTGSESSIEARKTVEDGVQFVEVSFSSTYNEVNIYVHLALEPLPAAEWPAEAIAEFLGEEVTDTLPAFGGEASSFQFYEEDGAVVIAVEAGTEADSVAAYQETLGLAGFVAVKADSYGDLIFVSANNQIKVNVYVASAGQIVVMFGLSDLDVSDTLPLDTINSFLGAYDFGFELTEAMFEGLEINWFAIETGLYYYNLYHYLELTVDGNVVAELEAAMATALEGAGFAYDEDDGCYYNEAYSAVEFSYNIASNTTSIWFGE